MNEQSTPGAATPASPLKGIRVVDLGQYIAGPGAITTTAVPEPETYVLMLVGLAALGIARRRLNSPGT